MILLVASTCLLQHGTPGLASSWASEKFEVYHSHPDWIKTRCENMGKVNQKGMSNFNEKVASLEKEYNPNFSRQSVKEIIQFYHLFGRKFCPSAW